MEQFSAPQTRSEDEIGDTGVGKGQPFDQDKARDPVLLPWVNSVSRTVG